MSYAQRDEFELPQALLDELLRSTDRINESVSRRLVGIKQERQALRRALEERGAIRTFVQPALHVARCCAVDGSYVNDRTLSADIIACAAVAVEGLPPGDVEPLWTQPHHAYFLDVHPHNEGIGAVLAGMMLAMEVRLAAESPHDVVLLDGSFFALPPTLNAAVAASRENPLEDSVQSRFVDEFFGFLSAMRQLASPSFPRIAAAVSKYTTAKHIGSMLGIRGLPDDRTLATYLLEEGEYVITPGLRRLGGQILIPGGGDEKTGELVRVLETIDVIYFRPSKLLPAVKLEVPRHVVDNDEKRDVLFSTILQQSGAPGMLEPYPLYLADRYAKSLRLAIATVRESAVLTGGRDGGLAEEDLFLLFQSFRTETGM